MKINSLLITKDLKEITLLEAYCKKKNIHLLAQSFISLKAIKTNSKIETEVIFFGSKNAFDFYLNQYNHDKNIQISCIGESTKKYIELKGFEVNFYGKEAGKPEEVSKDLNVWLKGRSICFVESTQSKKTIQKHIESKLKKSLILYETSFKPIRLKEDFEILVFTSPSNVEAFLMKNKINDHTKIIAWGKTTESALLKQNLRVDIVLKKASLKELILHLKSQNL